MTKEMIFQPHWADPADPSAPLILEYDGLKNPNTGNMRARLFRNSHRIEWFEGVPSELSERVAIERNKYDNWANDKREKIANDWKPLDPSGRSQNWWKGSPSDMVVLAAEDVEQLSQLKGNRILDIGGSLLDSWRFLWFGGAEYMDQIEVPPSSQELAYLKALRLFEKQPEVLERLWFHTAPAERMPFKNASFDVIFSRSTIHHCKRPEVFEEMLRVLKPGGIFWILEPRLSSGMYGLMKFARWARRADRGTDDPLRDFELEHLGQIAEIVRLDSSLLISPFFSFLFNQMGLDPQKGKRVALPIDNALEKWGLGKNKGRHISLVVRKPVKLHERQA
ncbi:methyltransferase domain-containing protein [Ectothiorhodospira haloalkaliphila]|uniref:class I SAM-dependent methyltransferase n=1 Tax=Ectothiorhodospira haloalkaliphila TaxID=421628 RepID=UPI001EE91B70|nr:class I SAM-dependent methyltransferase [Ectothiorhodospira haloalkaliphila]MCG5525279.1 methyltransferase domain-containing protein [Ectothiorhodospira haloalkaliphila]